MTAQSIKSLDDRRQRHPVFQKDRGHRRDQVSQDDPERHDSETDEKGRIGEGGADPVADLDPLVQQVGQFRHGVAQSGTGFAGLDDPDIFGTERAVLSLDRPGQGQTFQDPVEQLLRELLHAGILSRRCRDAQGRIERHARLQQDCEVSGQPGQLCLVRAARACREADLAEEHVRRTGRLHQIRHHAASPDDRVRFLFGARLKVALDEIARSVEGLEAVLHVRS
jgi:hypothetical protein